MNWWQAYKNDVSKAFKSHHKKGGHVAGTGAKIMVVGSNGNKELTTVDHPLSKHFEDSKLYITDFKTH